VVVLLPMVRRSLLRSEGGFDETLASATDCDMWLRLSFRTTLVGVGEPLLLVRAHPGSASADKSLNARMWLVILDKLARDQPAWVEANRWAFRRALGKERMRLGRELLVLSARSPDRLAESRAALAASVRVFPFFVRAWVYLAWSRLAPGRYAWWRRLERRLKP
jgi:hypothetical protein